MGLIVTEQYDLGCGLNVNSYYASINTNDIRMERRDEEYRDLQFNPETRERTETITKTTRYELNAGLTQWVSKEARDTGKTPIGRTRVHISQETPITGNVYDVIYAKFKEDHPNSTNA